MGRPHVLYIAFYFPPSRASGVHRALATANHLVADGARVTVFRPQREFFTDYIRSVDESLEERVDPRIEVREVPFSGREWEPDIRRYGWLRANLPTLHQRLVRGVERRLFPERYASWIPGLVRGGLALHRQDPVDVVLATGNPYASFAAVHLLGRLAGVPYVVDYRDPWTLDVFTGQELDRDDPAVRWERRIIERAAAAVFVNEPMRAWYRQRYPDADTEMVVVANGYDPGLVEQLDEAEGDGSARALTFGFLGTVTPALPLEEFFGGWRKARSHARLADARFRIYGYMGFFPESADRLRRAIPQEGESGVTYQGPVERAAIADAYASLDVLALITGSSPYLTSGKVFEYMATGKPLLVVNEPSTALREVTAGYPAKVEVDELTEGAVADALVEIAERDDLRTPDVREACRAYARRFERDRQLERLAALTRSVARG